MNEDQKQKFISLFQNQSLSKSDKDFWFSRLGNMKEEMIAHILALFEEFPKEIGWLRDIQERKDTALAVRNHEEWQAILKEEEEHFTQLSADKN